MNRAFESALSAILTIAAIAIAAVLVRREFFAKPTVSPATRSSEYVADWQALAFKGRTVGNSAAKVTIFEFTDLECPFCRLFNGTLKNVRSRFPTEVAYVIIHLPLSMHRFAKPAARAAECAGQAGRFSQMVDALFEKQDSLGLKSWRSFAQAAGVEDSLTFDRCVALTTPVTKIEEGLEVAKRLGVSSTPTVILNGWRYGAPPTEDELVRAIEDILAGRRPYAGYPSPAK